MKQKLLIVSVAALIGVCTVSTNALSQAEAAASGSGWTAKGMFDTVATGAANMAKSMVPSLTMASMSVGVATLAHSTHLAGKFCMILPNQGGPFCKGTKKNFFSDAPYTSIWFDLLLNGLTAVDIVANIFWGDRTIDAKDAIKKLEKALKGDENQKGNSGSGGTSGDSSLAAVYTADNIMYLIDLSEKKTALSLFDGVRQEIKNYLFETSDPNIKGECTQSDKECAVQRQNEWLMASVTLASATADKVLSQTAKKNVKDGQTAAEKEEDSKKDTAGTGGGTTTLKGHFSALAAEFNVAQSPMDLYNAMANIVLDTHRQINDANALLGRDLEAQGLRVISETGPVLLSEKSVAGEE